VRKTITAGIAVTVGLSTALATGAFAGGNGAQKSNLGPAQGGSMSNCQESSGSNGWAILNGPGQQGMVTTLNGEVHLVGGVPGQTYDIFLGMPGTSPNPNTCMDTMDTLTVNGQGIGNGHIDTAGMGGTYFIALFDHMSDTEEFATGEMTVS
jgi:hypothetical protein